MPGVIRTRVGYAGGTAADPTYHAVADHSETIQIDFDPGLISYAELLDVFWASHSPESRSFSRQYRSIVFYHSEEQKRLALETKAREEARKGKSLTTEVVPYSRFYRAEDYHQKYYLRQIREVMVELEADYATEEQLVDSTRAARLNGFLGGYGSRSELEQELQGCGLSDRAGELLLQRASRR